MRGPGVGVPGVPGAGPCGLGGGAMGLVLGLPVKNPGFGICRFGGVDGACGVEGPGAPGAVTGPPERSLRGEVLAGTVLALGTGILLGR